MRGLGWLLLLAPAMATAEPPPPADVEDWSLHAQATGIGQGHLGFHSPYEGPNSLSPDPEARDTVTATFFLGRRLWQGAAIYANPEVTQGTGLSDTLGVAGFPNGEATRAGTETPRINLARLFLRQTIGLGGGTERVEPDANQLGGVRDRNHLTFTVGKLAAVDLFDGNAISHDPRTQFMNWALMDNGACGAGRSRSTREAPGCSATSIDRTPGATATRCAAATSLPSSRSRAVRARSTASA